ncbi:hypothetical protein [Hydrogenimonas cancrithermarum]|uniref:Uncharacterized protein n=1 Tax=Hydrogenimonas cancrithermarum TaxID=2993563 RepID=A0ABM8FHP9_9BACT|nr:hypothetical protein [Hydrogenimonas cancrithermarum]BDY11815.1 hypothetical protein HCR_01270 [Hydrogenimonas cancrithermarum]
MITEEKVILLALLKKEEGENLRDILAMLENNRVFTMKEGKRFVKILKNEGYIEENELTLKGTTAAQHAEAEFKL